jgi:transposase-like protein
MNYFYQPQPQMSSYPNVLSKDPTYPNVLSKDLKDIVNKKLPVKEKLPKKVKEPKVKKVKEPKVKKVKEPKVKKVKEPKVKKVKVPRAKKYSKPRFANGRPLPYIESELLDDIDNDDDNSTDMVKRMLEDDDDDRIRILRKQYSFAERIQAVELGMKLNNWNEASRRLGICKQQLYKWRADYQTMKAKRSSIKPNENNNTDNKKRKRNDIIDDKKDAVLTTTYRMGQCGRPTFSDEEISILLNYLQELKETEQQVTIDQLIHYMLQQKPSTPPPKEKEEGKQEEHQDKQDAEDKQEEKKDQHTEDEKLPEEEKVEQDPTSSKRNNDDDDDDNKKKKKKKKQKKNKDGNDDNDDDGKSDSSSISTLSDVTAGKLSDQEQEAKPKRVIRHRHVWSFLQRHNIDTDAVILKTASVYSNKKIIE